MKHLNRNIYLLLIGIIEAVFIIYTVVMSRRENIETGELVFGCCAMAIMAAICIVVAFINKIGNKKEESPKLDFTEVPRSREGAIFEVLTLLIIAVAWTVAIVTNRFWMMEGSFFFLEPVTMFTLTILAITVLWIVYMPRFISMVRRHTNVKQVALEVRMCRVLAVELALLVLAYALPLEDFSTGFFYYKILLYITGAVLLVTVAVFRYLIYKARSNHIDRCTRPLKNFHQIQCQCVNSRFRYPVGQRRAMGAHCHHGTDKHDSRIDRNEGIKVSDQE